MDSAKAIHGDEASCKRHAAMGFREGWGKALDQLVAMAKKQRSIAWGLRPMPFT